MPWDLKWHEFKDLEFSPSADIVIVGGDELVHQRIMVRLIMMRGWIYDSTGDLGSNLYGILSDTAERAIQDIPALVLEALAPMNDEITVMDVLVTNVNEASGSLQVIVEYRKNNLLANPSSVQRLVFPLS
jgi:phage gp46-like protein